jgi:hypothetical protein
MAMIDGDFEVIPMAAPIGDRIAAHRSSPQAGQPNRRHRVPVSAAPAEIRDSGRD